MHARIVDITHFLIDFKKAAQSDFTFVKRKVNLDCLSRLRITIGGAKSTIYSLIYKNYVSGPERDRGRKKSNVWFFWGLYKQSRSLYKIIR